MGVSIACFFTVYFLKRNKAPKRRAHEAVYAPADEVLKYSSHRASEEYSPSHARSFNVSGAEVHENTPTTPPSNKDDFVEYSANVVSRDSGKENAKIAPDDDENSEDDEKKSKLSALRFFNS